MDLEVLLQFVRPELLILVAVLWCLGFFLKKAPWFQEEWMIPFILLFLGMVLAVLYIGIVLVEGFSAAAIISGICQGILVAALAVLINEAGKQLFVKRMEDKNKLKE